MAEAYSSASFSAPTAANYVEAPAQSSSAVSQAPSQAPAAPTHPAPDFKVFKPSTKSSVTSPSPSALPDEYFEMSGAEAKVVYQSQLANRERINNAPFVSREAREKEAKTKLNKWPTTTIRIKFSDRTQLEKSFPSTNRIQTVYDFVRGALRPELSTAKFMLYQTPPRRDFNPTDPKVKGLTLAELQLAPSSVLLIRFDNAALNGRSATDRPAPLRTELSSHAIELPAAPTFENKPRSDKPTLTPSKAANAAGDAAKKIPKWFKVGQKK